MQPFRPFEKSTWRIVGFIFAIEFLVVSPYIFVIGLINYRVQITQLHVWLQIHVVNNEIYQLLIEPANSILVSICYNIKDPYNDFLMSFSYFIILWILQSIFDTLVFILLLRLYYRFYLRNR
jgi:hypothetical protein